MGLFKRQHKQVRQPHITDDTGVYAFRRSRTMTGSSSDSVQSAAEAYADLQSDRLKHHTLRKQRRHLGLYLLIVLICLIGLVLLVNNFMISTSMRQIQGVSTTDVNAYKAAVNSYLSDHPNERFIFSLRGTALLESVQKQYPEVRAITIDVQPWLQPALVRVDLRTPIASWTIGSTKYYIDGGGVAFRKNHRAEPALIVEDETGINPNDTAAVASERMIRYIGRLVALLKQGGLTVERLILPPATSREVDVRLSGISYTIKTDIDRDPAGQAADVAQAVGYLSHKGIVPSYADVRVSSKLYYK